MPPKRVIIKFFKMVDEPAVKTLLSTIDDRMKQGVRDFALLLSSPGGNVFVGLSAYNYMRGLPVEITTHNFGMVDSISLILYCAGKKRLSVPQARILLHPVQAQLNAGQYEEKALEELLKGLRIDTENIAKVIAETTGKKVEEITKAMTDRTTLNPEEAKKWGLVQEITSSLVDADSELVTIQ
jgi:ATP-dependent protease ClpP protease subunit